MSTVLLFSDKYTAIIVTAVKFLVHKQNIPIMYSCQARYMHLKLWIKIKSVLCAPMTTISHIHSNFLF